MVTSVIFLMIGTPIRAVKGEQAQEAVPMPTSRLPDLPFGFRESVRKEGLREIPLTINCQRCIIISMKRTRIQIPDTLYREVKRVAKLLDWSVSGIVTTMEAIHGLSSQSYVRINLAC